MRSAHTNGWYLPTKKKKLKNGNQTVLLLIETFIFNSAEITNKKDAVVIHI